jgi:hypothetical protein
LTQETVSNVTRETPGNTDRTIHRICTMDATPIRQKLYRIPEAHKKQDMDELQEMEKNGINNSWRVSGLVALILIHCDNVHV